MKYLVPVLLLMMMLSGCLNSGATTSEGPVVPEMETIIESENHSHQFMNIQPMSVANNTAYEVNGSVWVMANWTWVFHEPVLWEQGNMTMQIMVGNESNNTVVWESTPANNTGSFNLSLDSLNTTLTLRVQATGSDNPTDNLPADWFHVHWYVEVMRPVSA
jgi:hypothetical protein